MKKSANAVLKEDGSLSPNKLLGESPHKFDKKVPQERLKELQRLYVVRIDNISVCIVGMELVCRRV